jgi:hypothetical protein
MLQPSDDLPFWEFARELKQGMRASQTREGVTQMVTVINGMVQHEGDPDDPTTIGALPHDLMVSNYGNPGVRTNFGHLKLKSLYPSVLSGEGETQTISVLTVGGALHITLVSRQPFPSLVEDACDILHDACLIEAEAAD